MMSLSEFWPLCLECLKKQLSADQFHMWAGKLTADEDEDAWVIFAPNDFVLNLVRNTYLPIIQKAKEEIAPDSPALDFRSGKGRLVYLDQAKPTSKKQDAQKPAGKASKTPSKSSQAQSAQPVLSSSSTKGSTDGYDRTQLKPEHTFDSLVLGKGNNLAYHAALAISEALGKKDYNPFFVYGSTGLGKTHLVQAVANNVFQLDPKAKIRYVHADKYISDYIRSVRNHDWDAFKVQYHSLDLLILDDVQFIAGKEKTMEEFFYLFNRFLDDGKQIILTSDRLPSEIDKMDNRLKSRFSWGLSVEIEPPEFEMRVAILMKKASMVEFNLPENVAFFIAQNIRSNVRDLEGALNRVRAHCRFVNQKPDLDIVKIALKDILAVGQKQITVESIQKTVANYFQIKELDMRGKKRQRNIARPRQMAMSLAKELTQLSLPAIGEAFGGRDHTTVLHATKTIAKLKLEDTEIAEQYDTLCNMLRS